MERENKESVFSADRAEPIGNGVLRVCTAYLPPLDYCAALVRAGSFQVETAETYPKQTIRNRARIVTSQGVLTLSVPCIRPQGNHTPVSEVLIDAKQAWARVHWRGICTAYNNSPYFLYYKDEWADLYQWAEKEARAGLRLLDFNDRILDLLVQKLRLPVRRLNVLELRSKEGVPENGTTKGGFVPPLDFDAAQAPCFAFEPYMQTFPCDADVARLSILDLLFNVGPQSLAYLQSARFQTW